MLLASPAQETRPDATGHNRAFHGFYPVGFFWGLRWDNQQPIIQIVAWIRGRRSPPSSDGTRGPSGAGRRKALCRYTAFRAAPRDGSSPTQLSLANGSARLKRPGLRPTLPRYPLTKSNPIPGSLTFARRQSGQSRRAFAQPLPQESSPIVRAIALQ